MYILLNKNIRIFIGDIYMKFVPKNTKQKESSVYKSLYLKEDLAKKVEEIAKVNNTSFNNVIISMIEFCLLEDDEKDNDKK